MALTIILASSPLSVIDSNVHNTYKSHIVDGHVYNTSAGVYPTMTSACTFTISGGTSSSRIIVYHNDIEYRQFLGSTSYTFSIIPTEGNNTLYARQGDIQSNTIQFMTDNLYALVSAMPFVLEEREESIRQAWADGYLSDNVVLDTHRQGLLPSEQSLTQNWGALLSTPRISGMTRSEYLAILQGALTQYQKGAVEGALIGVGEILGDIGGTGSTLLSLTSQFGGGYLGSLRPLVYADGADTVKVYPFKIRQENRNYSVNHTTGLSVSAYDIDQGASDGFNKTGELFVVAIPGGSSATGGPITPTITAQEPHSNVVLYQETFTASQLQVDTGGTITGLADGVYLVLERVPYEIVSISGSAYSLSGSSRVVLDYKDNNTPILDLGARVSPTDLLTGNTILTIQYLSILAGGNNSVLARLVCNITTGGTPSLVVSSIEEIHSCNRASWGAINRTARTTRSFGLMLDRSDIDGGLYSVAEKEFSQSLVRKLAPVGSPGYLMHRLSPSVDPFIIHHSGYTLHTWCRASEITGLTHGDEVTQWRNIVRDMPATGSPGSCPIYITGGTTNGSPTVRFGDGTGATYLSFSTGLLQTFTGMTIFFVSKSRSIDPTFGVSQTLMCATQDASNNPIVSFYKANLRGRGLGAQVLLNYGNPVDSLSGWANTLHLTGYTVDCLVVDSANDVISIHQNGLLVNTKIAAFGTMWPIVIPSTAITIGTASPIPTSRLYGDITDILIFSSVLPEWAIRGVSNYLYHNTQTVKDVRLARSHSFYKEIR